METYDGNIFQLMDELSIHSNTQYILDYEDRQDILFKKIHMGQLFGMIKITISINKKDINNLVIPKTSNEQNPTTLANAIGFNDEYKLLFDVLKYSTKLNKNEISYLLRHDSVCEDENTDYIFLIEFSPRKLY